MQKTKTKFLKFLMQTKLNNIEIHRMHKMCNNFEEWLSNSFVMLCCCARNQHSNSQGQAPTMQTHTHTNRWIGAIYGHCWTQTQKHSSAVYRKVNAKMNGNIERTENEIESINVETDAIQ